MIKKNVKKNITLRQNLICDKTQTVIKLQNSNCDKTQNIYLRKNSKTQIKRKENCYKTQKLKL